MNAHRIREAIAAAVLVKAPTWSEDHRWHVMSGDLVLIVIEPAYSGLRRNGWRWLIADLGPSNIRITHPTRQDAAVAGLGAWQRWASARKETT